MLHYYDNTREKLAKSNLFKHEFCGDILGQNMSVMGSGGRYDRAPCRDVPRGRARETERKFAFAAWTLKQSTPQRAAEHHPGVAVNSCCSSMWVVVFPVARALSL